MLILSNKLSISHVKSKYSSVYRIILQLSRGLRTIIDDISNCPNRIGSCKTINIVSYNHYPNLDALVSTKSLLSVKDASDAAHNMEAYVRLGL